MPSGPLPVRAPPFVAALEALPDAVPPGSPDCGPSGEIETRAERFPAGIAGGGAGAGVAESAMKVSVSPVASANFRRRSVRSPFFASLARGADIGLTGRSGFDGACEDEAMVITPACFSCGTISGAAASATATDAGDLGRRLVSSFAVSCSLGRSGWEAASCTILGSSGNILGGSGGAFGRTSVCRGWFGCNGSERIVCRGWNASAPRGGGSDLRTSRLRSRFRRTRRGKYRQENPVPDHTR